MHSAYGSCDHGLIVDPRPGNYYVSVQNGKRRALLRGPFATHIEALALVDETRQMACNIDPRGHWYAYGTGRLIDGEPAPAGMLNDKFSTAEGSDSRTLHVRV